MSDGETFYVVARTLFSVGFVFIICVAVWSVIVVTRMRREQLVGLTLLFAMAQRAGFKELIDMIQSNKLINGLGKELAKRGDDEKEGRS